MQYLKQGSESTVRVPPGSRVCLSYNGGAPATIKLGPKDGSFCVNTGVCGRVDAVVNGELREFMVICETSYDAFVTGASLFEANVKRVANADATRLADFYTQGYDHEKHVIAGIEHVNSVGCVEKPVPIEDKALTDRLAALEQKVAALDRPERIVKANVVQHCGEDAKKVVDQFSKKVDALADKDRVVQANVVRWGDKDAPVERLADFVLKGYDPTTHAVAKVKDVTETATVTKPVDANVVSFGGDKNAGKNAKAAFDGSGYSFEKCSMPVVKSVDGTVSADVDKLKGKDAQNLADTFCGKGFDFQGSSMPKVGEVETVPKAVLADDQLTGICEAVEALADKLAAWTKKPVPADLKLVGGRADVLAAIIRAFSDAGYDFPNSSIAAKYKNTEAKRALRDAARDILKEEK